MIDHALVSNRLEQIHNIACERDYHSPRCRFVHFELDVIEAYINHYSKGWVR
jgi:hypothetical protein